MNYDDSLERDRELAEGGESYDKIWVILYITGRFEKYDTQEIAEAVFTYSKIFGAAEYGWISEKDYSNNDYAWNYKHFNPVI